MSVFLDVCLYVCIRFVFVQFVIMRDGYENSRLAIIVRAYESVRVTTTAMLDENALVDI